MNHQAGYNISDRTINSHQKKQTASPDAIAFLTNDHNKTKALFKAINKLKAAHNVSDKMELVKKVCGDLLIHMAVEETIFYPAVRGQLHDDDLMNEATVEHDSAKELIVQLGQLQASDPMFDAKVKVLSEYIDHHVKEEETEMFAAARRADVDLVALGRQLIDATNAMRVQYGLGANYN